VVPPSGWRIAPAPLVAQLDQLAQAGRGHQLVLAPSRQHRHLNSLFADEVVGDGRRDDPDVVISPRDAELRGIVEGQVVQLDSGHGVVQGRARVDPHMRVGAVTLPHGYGGTNVNRLTNAVELDPLTGMPTYSGVPVDLSAV